VGPVKCMDFKLLFLLVVRAEMINIQKSGEPDPGRKSTETHVIIKRLGLNNFILYFLML
jgi:hypothetical protein